MVGSGLLCPLWYSLNPFGAGFGIAGTVAEVAKVFPGRGVMLGVLMGMPMESAIGQPRVTR